VELVWSAYFTNAQDAVACERQVKGWSRVKKDALIRGDEAALKAFSQRGFRPASILRDVATRSVAPPQDEAGLRSHRSIGAAPPQDETGVCGEGGQG
jgi:hypothetical protein